MNQKSIVKLTNLIGLVAIFLLIYWVFIYISIEVFGLRVFQRNFTETFYMSVLGILALMTGALIINIMVNLTRIANKPNPDTEYTFLTKHRKLLAIIFVISFPVIFVFMYAGDRLSATKKKNYLISSAEQIIKSNPDKIKQLADYKFDKNYILKADEILELLSKTDENFPSISIIVYDSISTVRTFLKFSQYYHTVEDTLLPDKKEFMYPTSQEEKQFLINVFTNKSVEPLFSASKGNYELYYPFIDRSNVIVLYFADYQRYGKLGS